MRGPTRRQRDVLRAIASLTRERGYPPTVAEIGEAVGLRSTSSVWFHLEALLQKGYLTREPRQPRTLKVTPLCEREAREREGVM